MTTEVAAQSAASAVQSAYPGSVVRAWIDAMKVSDGARILAPFAPDAPRAHGDGKPKAGPAFFASRDSDIVDRKGQVDDPPLAVNGSEVIATGQYRYSRGAPLRCQRPHRRRRRSHRQLADAPLIR